jgi:hypothetical protein
MIVKQFWTWILVVAGSLAICCAAAFAIEDAGKNPYRYRSYQKTSTELRPKAAPIDLLDGLVPFMR